VRGWMGTARVLARLRTARRRRESGLARGRDLGRFGGRRVQPRLRSHHEDRELALSDRSLGLHAVPPLRYDDRLTRFGGDHRQRKSDQTAGQTEDETAHGDLPASLHPRNLGPVLGPVTAALWGGPGARYGNAAGTAGS